MNNITIINEEEYGKITGIKDKKIKLTGLNLITLKQSAKKEEVKEEVAPEIEEDVKAEVKVEKEEEPKVEPYSYNRREYKEPEYKFDEEAIKEKVAENYGNFVKEEPKKEEKKVELKEEITEKEFEKLLNTPVTIMQDEVEMIRTVYDKRKANLKEVKDAHTRKADDFQKISNEDQNAKSLNETRKKRISDMSNKNHFTYLDANENEDPRILEQIERVNKELRALYELNSELYNKTNEQIENYAKEKASINKESEELRKSIQGETEELVKYRKENTPRLEKILKLNENYRSIEEESTRAIKDEYEAIKKEEQPVNIFESFRRESLDDKPRTIINVTSNSFENDDDISFRRAI